MIATLSQLFSAITLIAAGLNLPAATLNGEARVFPRDAAQPRSIFVVTFSKSATAAGARWTRTLRDNKDSLSAPIYQVAVLEDVPGFLRRFVISAIAKDVPDSLHGQFWIATSGTQQWQECAGSTSSEQPHVFVLDGRSQIVWRAHGDVTPQGIRELLALSRPLH